MFNKKTIFVAVLGTLISTTSVAAYPPAVPVTDLETFFGMAPGAISTVNPGAGIYLDPPVEGSGIKDSFGFVIGDVISFDYNFMTTEYPDDFINDYAFVSIGGQVALLDHVLGSPLSVSTDPNVLESGYKSFSFLAASTGVFDFGVGIVDVADAVGDSALLIDNIKVTRGSNLAYMDGFEIADPASIGDVEALWGGFNGNLPTEGEYQMLITTAPGMAPVPLPPAIWLLFSGVAALMGFSRSQHRAS